MSKVKVTVKVNTKKKSVRANTVKSKQKSGKGVVAAVVAMAATVFGEVKAFWAGNRFISEVKVPFTAKLLAEYSSYLRLDSERRRSQRHIRQMAGAMVTGKFNWAEVTIIVAKIGNKTYIINASHFLAALNLCIIGEYVPTIRVQTYRMPNVDIAKSLWIDCDRGIRRGKNQRVAGKLVGTPGFKDVDRVILQKLQQGLNWHLSKGVVANDLTDRELCELLEEGGTYHKAAMAIKQVLIRHPSREIFRTASVGAFFAMYLADSEHATKFWEEVSIGDAASDTICRILHNNLHRIKVPNNRQCFTGAELINAGTEVVYRMCIELWNSWCTGTNPVEVEVLVKLVSSMPARADVRVKVGHGGRNKVLKK